MDRDQELSCSSGPSTLCMVLLNRRFRQQVISPSLNSSYSAASPLKVKSFRPLSLQKALRNDIEPNLVIEYVIHFWLSY